jgi:hypothetical protein
MGSTGAVFLQPEKNFCINYDFVLYCISKMISQLGSKTKHFPSQSRSCSLYSSGGFGAVTRCGSSYGSGSDEYKRDALHGKFFLMAQTE